MPLPIRCRLFSSDKLLAAEEEEEEGGGSGRGTARATLRLGSCILRSGHLLCFMASIIVSLSSSDQRKKKVKSRKMYPRAQGVRVWKMQSCESKCRNTCMFFLSLLYLMRFVSAWGWIYTAMTKTKKIMQRRGHERWEQIKMDYIRTYIAYDEKILSHSSI